jgi:histidinol-phosphate aminotransferase
MAVAWAKPGIEKIKPHMVTGDQQDVPPVWALLNSNESGHGPSPRARAAAIAAVSGLERYLENPDQILAPAIACYFGLDARRITIGQGSDDLLARLARAYLGPNTELVRSANGYLKVPNYAYANDADVVSVPDIDFKPSVDGMIDALTDKTRIVYLANPENPAGTYLSGQDVRRLHTALPENALLVIDAAYEEYVDAADYEPAHLLVEEAQNVVMCRTFSKIFGLAGARVGWLYGPDDVIDTVRRIGVTFPAASTSVAAAVAALEDREHTEMVFSETRKNRNWLSEQLSDLGLAVVPSQGNFILVHFPETGKSATAADHALQQAGIAVRRFNAPAYRNSIRITIGHPEQMQAAVRCISEFLRGER